MSEVTDAMLSEAGRANPPTSGVAVIAGLSTDTLNRFADAARALKSAEDALVAARQAYAEAVKALSEEAVK